MKIIFLILAICCFVSTPLLAQPYSPQHAREQALFDFALDGNLEAVKELVTGGAGVNVSNPDLRTPLMLAAFNGHTAVVRFLLEQDARVDAKDSGGRTALLFASSGPFPETVELLLDKGAEVNTQGTLEGFTALMTAAAEGNLEVVKILLAHGATVGLKDKDGDTAENFARQNRHTAVAEVLAQGNPSEH